MNIMETVRGTTQSGFMKLVFAGICISFVFWGIGGQGPTSTVIAEVNGERITDTQFQKVMRQQSRSNRSRSDDEAEAMKNQVISNLIAEKVLMQEADRLGLEVSEGEIARYIREIPAFRSEDGDFSFALYERTLQAYGLTKGEFQEDLREDLMIGKLLELATLTVQVSPEQVREFYVDQNSSLSLRWVQISDANFRDDVEVTQDEIEAYVGTQAETISTFYESRKARRFTTPRAAKLRTILLKKDVGELSEDAVLARMEKVEKALAEGGDFAALARSWSEDRSAGAGGLVGLQEEPDMDPAIAEAVFATAPGSVTKILETARGFQIFRVESLREEVVTSLEDAASEIARELIVNERAPQLADTFAEELSAAWVAGPPPAAMLAAQSLTPGTADELPLSATAIPRLGPAAGILDAARAASDGAVLGEIFRISGTRVIVQVTALKRADDVAFEAAREGLRKQLLLRERLQFAQAWRQDLVGRALVTRYF